MCVLFVLTRVLVILTRVCFLYCALHIVMCVAYIGRCVFFILTLVLFILTHVFCLKLTYVCCVCCHVWVVYIAMFLLVIFPMCVLHVLIYCFLYIDISAVDVDIFVGYIAMCVCCLYRHVFCLD